jgi:hypothetical protein
MLHSRVKGANIINFQIPKTGWVLKKNIWNTILFHIYVALKFKIYPVFEHGFYKKKLKRYTVLKIRIHLNLWTRKKCVKCASCIWSSMVYLKIWESSGSSQILSEYKILSVTYIYYTIAIRSQYFILLWCETGCKHFLLYWQCIWLW